MTTDLAEIIYGNKVDQKFFIPESSQFLVNLLVVVPQRKEKDFLDNYVVEDAKNDTAVVPGSAQYLNLEDEEKNRIYRVVLF